MNNCINLLSYICGDSNIFTKNNINKLEEVNNLENLDSLDNLDSFDKINIFITKYNKNKINENKCNKCCYYSSLCTYVISSQPYLLCMCLI
jgi:hypothetical protein